MTNPPNDFRISEDRVRQIARNRATHLNAEARQAGQQQRVTATDLEDLYYKQGGRCAITGFLLEDHGANKHPLAIRADHIQNVNRRSTFFRIANGEHVCTAALADINNIQWVCHMANTFKQLVVGYGMNWADVIAGCHSQAINGFPIRANALVCGSVSTKRGKRIELMQAEFERLGHALNSHDIHSHFVGTELEAHYSTILKELKSIGWCGARHASEMRRQVVQQMAADAIATGKQLNRMIDWCAELNRIIKERFGWPSISVVRFRQICEELGVTFRVSSPQSKTLLRDASAAEKVAIREYLRDKGREGACESDLENDLASDTFVPSLFPSALAQLTSNGQIERHGNRLFYCMTRKEAAETIGVSVHRLKKWAVFETGPKFLKSATNPKGECYYSVRTLYEFAELRTPTPFDLVGHGA